jgi:formylglycine-generating enzyme
MVPSVCCSSITVNQSGWNGVSICLVVFVRVLLLMYGLAATAATATAATIEDTTNEIMNEIPHPDPNDEEHPGMLYVGRLCTLTKRRLLANESYSIQYRFGTSFVDDDDDSTKRDDPPTSNEQKPTLQRFGHVETHPLDGGVLPPTMVTVEPFWLDATPVTNQEFADFVAHTYYITEAERYGWSYVLESLLVGFTDHKQSLQFDSIDTRTYEVDPGAQHWVACPSTDWKRPQGLRTTYKGQEDHPVVHVSHRDAAEYCSWRKKRLPGEREYEAAARWYHVSPTEEPSEQQQQPQQSYLVRNKFLWGNESSWEIAMEFANLWGKGEFPSENLGWDRYKATSPVKAYPPNINGFYDLTGNVWEWMRGGTNKKRILRGSSYVDTLDGSYNHAATLGARAETHGTTTAGNIGFRCAKSVQKREEHHWTWHDEETHGELSPEEEYQYEGDEDEIENDDDATTKNKRKKKKVVLKREQIRTEL